MLEMDDQQSSINASDQFHVAVAANTGQASQHVEICLRTIARARERNSTIRRRRSAIESVSGSATS